MAKRRLSKNQFRRIRNNQNASTQRASSEQPAPLDQELGPEQKGRVIAHYGTQVEVESTQGELRRCFLRANLESVITGDNVIWCAQADAGVVVSLEERRSLLSRPDSYGKLKPVAANVDQIIITVAPKPEVFTNLIDRYIVICEINGIKPVILINKADLIDNHNGAFFESLQGVYKQLGYTVILTSTKTPQNIATLKTTLENRTSIFVGQSGVGKSSIIKHFLPEETILVGSLSQAKTKGRHTTTHSRLFRFTEGGECIDSPGIREFGLWHLTKEQVTQGFVEISKLAGQCKFRDCRHEGEPACALTNALENNTITHNRFESYKRIIASLDDVDVKQPNTRT